MVAKFCTMSRRNQHVLSSHSLVLDSTAASTRAQLNLSNLGNPMARVTVEDCLENVDNRFELIMVSAKRARLIATGGKDPLVELKNPTLNSQ